jgi:hypothetical protein
MGARHYDPKSGSFLSPDPLGHGECPDLYSYAHGDPVNCIDPDGRRDLGLHDRPNEVNVLGQHPDGPEAAALAWQAYRYQKHSGTFADIRVPGSNLNLGEFSSAAFSGAAEGLSSGHGQVLTGTLLLLTTGGSGNVYVATVGGSTGGLTFMKGIGQSIAEMAAGRERGREIFGTIPSSIPQMGGALGGGIIDNDPRMGIKAVSIAENLMSLRTLIDGINDGPEAVGFVATLMQLSNVSDNTLINPSTSDSDSINEMILPDAVRVFPVGVKGANQ